MGSCPKGWLDAAVCVMPSPAASSEARHEQGPFPPAVLPAFAGTTSPSDSRSPPCAFALGLYARPSPDVGRRDGSLVFRLSPSARAAPRTPPRPPAHPDSRAGGVAFAVTCAARLSDCDSDEAAGFTSYCGPRCCFPPTVFTASGFRHRASPVGISASGAGLLPGSPAITRAGLSPAEEMQHGSGSAVASAISGSVPSRRTIGRGVAPCRYLRPVSTLLLSNRTCGFP